MMKNSQSLQLALFLILLIISSLIVISSSYIISSKYLYKSILLTSRLSLCKIPYNSRDSKSSKDSMRKPSRSPNRRPRPPSLQDNIKLARFARTIRDELSDILGSMDIRSNTMPDEDLFRGTSITDVEVSPDMSTAKITISVLGNSVEKRKLYLWLCDNVSQVRFSLAKRIRYIRRIPLLTFKLLDSQTAEMMNIMEEEAMRRLANAQAMPMEIDFEEDDEDE